MGDDRELEEGTRLTLEFDKLGRIGARGQHVVPVVLQNAETGAVLFVGYANREALRETLSRREAVLWSTSRDELWHKGATSGNVQKVRALRYDCDADAVLALVEPAGPACHTGERTCFHNGELEPVPGEALATLERTIAERRAAAPEDSYTARLLADRELVAAKVREEAEEVTRAVREEPDERVAEEAADVLYHLTVLLRSRGRDLADAEEVLLGRRR